MKAFALVATLVVGAASAAEIPSEQIQFFEQKIRPVLVEHCYECHSADAKKLKGNLYLDSKHGWQRGGDSGDPVIVPGKPEESFFIKAVRHDDRDIAMPPKKPRLPDAVIADLVAWVKMGAPDPRTGTKQEAKRGDKSWWSLQPLEREFEHESIDGFIAAKLATKNLHPNPPADPRTLIRRMTYDLHGLPPTMAEVEEFSKACAEAEANGGSRANVIERTIDRLLASPRYGEHWGRHWLDVVRFGESNGFERNFIIDDLWPFRDYVIRSFNEDKPMNRFIVEHLAGDVIGKDNPSVEIGSAFLVAGPYDDVGNQDPVAKANIRAATLDDIITAAGGAFLGLTVNCARCHNHKFDPIPMEDYYRLRAAFEGVQHGRRVVATKSEREAYAAAMKPLEKRIAALNREKQGLDKAVEDRARAVAAKKKSDRPKVDPYGTHEEFAPVEARFVRFVIHGLSNAPQSVKGGILTEFQVWNCDGRNVALASHGTTAAGAKSATAEDFPEAYGPQYCIDGTLGEAWFIGNPPVLTLTLPRTEKIQRVTFISAREERQNKGQNIGATPTEYDIQVSRDGKQWQTVASNEGREAWTPKHAIAHARREVITPDENARMAELDREIETVKAAMARVPKPREMWAGRFTQPKERTFVHKGGDPMKPTDPVVPASLDVLGAVVKPYELPIDAPEGERRLALGRWITAEDNPLTPRVLANRVWHHHFGTGLVDTPSDFGFLGSKPTHPELLDFLARRLIANGWKLKALHREIMLSSAYQQSAGFRADAAREDKDARLLWRFPPRRLSAEEVRDTLLTVAGVMKLEPMGGPGFRLYKFTQNNVATYFPLDQHGADTYRRAVYHQNARASVVDLLSEFDFPDTAFAAPKRAATTTPLQALTLLNHSFTLDMAKAFASHLEENDPIGTAYGLAFQRAPSVHERKAAGDLIAAHGPAAFCRALLNANELLHLE